MSLWCLPSSFGSIRLALWEMLFGKILRWPPWRPSWISEWEDFSNSEFPCQNDASHQVLAQSHMVWEGMAFEEFKVGRHGGHFGNRNGTILAILNLYITTMPPIKFRLNLSYCLEGDVVWWISRLRPPWILEWNDFSNCESLCHCDTSHKVSAQSDLLLGRRCRLKNSKMATMVAILDIWMERL